MNSQTLIALMEQYSAETNCSIVLDGPVCALLVSINVLPYSSCEISLYEVFAADKKLIKYVMFIDTIWIFFSFQNCRLSKISVNYLRIRKDIVFGEEYAVENNIFINSNFPIIRLWKQ